MAKMKEIHDDWLDMLNQLDNKSVRNLVLLMILELEEWSQNQGALAIVRGHTDMLLNKFSFLIAEHINKINKGEEQ
tara:strand:- start:541 stop:768 length:228 start_codon:yes stop_codon:yes gene_type:complete